MDLHGECSAPSLPQVMHGANLRFATRAGVAEWQTRMVQVQCDCVALM